MIITTWNHNKATLDLDKELEDIGVSVIAYPPNEDEDADVVIMHCRGRSENENEVTREGILNCTFNLDRLRNRGLLIFVSSVGLNESVRPQLLKQSQGDIFVFGINRAVIGSGKTGKFLTKEEWNAIFEWAKKSKDAQYISDLEEVAGSTVRELLWPTSKAKRDKMAFVVLCEGYLFAFYQQAAKRALGKDVIDALQIMKCEKGQKASAEQQKEIAEIWRRVQQSEWWLRVFRTGNDNNTLTDSERADAVNAITELLGKEAKSSRDSKQLIHMIENDKVTDANVVARAFIRLEEELA